VGPFDPAGLPPTLGPPRVGSPFRSSTGRRTVITEVNLIRAIDELDRRMCSLDQEVGS
jgi:hypothetical protein